MNSALESRAHEMLLESARQESAPMSTLGRLLGLPAFPSPNGLPKTPAQLRAALASSGVAAVACFALGPEGTNIAHAARRWIKKMRVGRKAEVLLCNTPEESIEAAEAVTQPGVLAVFWTCAVYYREHEVFFRNPETFPFFTQQVMPLDEMQLATRPELCDQADAGGMTAAWRILSHPSPAPLLAALPCSVTRANSNAEAAVRCRAGEVEACVTTETARALNGLVTLHSFGSPNMVFFGGITRHGAALLRGLGAEIPGKELT